MDLLEIKLDCYQITSHQKLKNKFGKIHSPACEDQTIHVEQCLSKESMLRNKKELSLDKNLKDELMIKLDDQFDKVVNQIDLQCEILIKAIKDYSHDLIDKLQMEKRELRMEIESMDTQEMSKESFVNQFPKEVNLSQKQYQNEVEEQKQKILDRIKECEYCPKVPETNIQELMGSLKLNNKFNMTKSGSENVDMTKNGIGKVEMVKNGIGKFEIVKRGIGKVDIAKSEKKIVDYFNDVLDRKGSAWISLKSKLNEKFVTADFYSHRIAILKSNKTQVGDSELFALVKNKDNTVTILSKFGKRFSIVSPYHDTLAAKYQDDFYAKSSLLVDWEKFYLINNEDGSFSFRTLITKQYVISADGQSGYLVARGDEINDDQKFYIEVRNCQEEIKINEVEEIKKNEVEKINRKPDKTRYRIVHTSTTTSTPNTSSCSIS